MEEIVGLSAIAQCFDSVEPNDNREQAPSGVLVPAEKRYRPEIPGRRPFLIVATGSGKQYSTL
jgi:hypothetical protein